MIAINVDQTNEHSQQIKKYIEEIKKTNNIKNTWLNKYDEEIQKILIETKQNPEGTLQCMLQQQKDKLTMSQQINDVIESCLSLEDDFQMTLEDRRKTLGELIMKVRDNFYGVIRTCDESDEECMMAIKHEVLPSVGSLRNDVLHGLEVMKSVNKGIKPEVDKCFNISERILEEFLNLYTGYFRQCLKAMAK